MEFDNRDFENNPVRLMCRLRIASKNILDQLLPEIRAFRPDYILHDSTCSWGLYCGALLQVPTICSLVTFAHLALIALNIPATGFASLRWRYLARDEMWKAQAIMHELHTTYHLKKRTLYKELDNPGDMTLVYTARSFQPFARFCPPSMRFVGPSIAARPATSEFPFERLTDAPLIYISLGTIFNDQLDFYHTCFEAFAGQPYQVVLSIGNSSSSDLLGTPPANFIVMKSVPQLEILQRAALFITHGGMNSASEALSYGVPMLVIPQALDQFTVAKQVVRRGAGKRLFTWQVNPLNLRHIANEILSRPAFARASTRVGKELHEAGGYKQAAAEIEFLKRQHNIV